MIRYVVGFYSMMTILGCSLSDAEHVVCIESAIDSIGQVYAPDKRVAIYDLEVRAGVLTGQTNLIEAYAALITALKDQGCSFVDSIDVLQPGHALVNVSVCNIRSRPGHSSELSTQALMGTRLQVYDQEGNWFRVQTPDGYLGWVDDGGLVMMSRDTLSHWMSGEKLVVVAPFAFVYAQNEDIPVSDVVEGNILLKVGHEGLRTKVSLPDGRVGLIDADAIISYEDFLQPKAPLADHIIRTSMQMLGRPYLWGGTSGKAMDCSGFTKTVFYLNGLELPRDASQQVRVGLDVESDQSLKNLKRGDFLFFGSPSTPDKKERITHVAIYMGDGKIIHASDRVQIESLRPEDPDFAPERLSTLVRARRMLEGIGENGVRPLSEHAWYLP